LLVYGFGGNLASFLYRLKEEFVKEILKPYLENKQIYEASKNEKDKYKKIAVLESAFKTDINKINFLPYIQLVMSKTMTILS
jgi:hypothetical protein